MRVTRIHVDAPLADGATVRLSDRATAHVIRVLRLQPGDPLVVFDGAGREHAATLAAPRAGAAEVRVGAATGVDAESRLAITLVQGVSRGERMDYAIQKATELGVRRIVPVLAERTVVRLDATQAARRLEHWTGIAIAACEQCGRSRVPAVEPPRRFLDWLGEARPPAAATSLKLLLSPDGTHAPRDLPPEVAEVELLIGPEGGLTGDEERLALSRGFVGLRLGPRILRTETAAAAAIAVLQALRGDLG